MCMSIFPKDWTLENRQDAAREVLEGMARDSRAMMGMQEGEIPSYVVVRQNRETDRVCHVCLLSLEKRETYAVVLSPNSTHRRARNGNRARLQICIACLERLGLTETVSESISEPVKKNLLKACARAFSAGQDYINLPGVRRHAPHATDVSRYL